MLPRSILRLLAVAAVLLAVGPVRAQLAAVSPFMPPSGARGVSTLTANAPLEYRGVAELPGGAAFRVVDPSRKTGVWVKLNELDPELGVVVKQHDAEHETVVVEYQGRTLTLPLHQSKVASAGAAMPNPANLVMPPPAALAPTPAAPPALAAQQAQLDAVAAAVAQRRALREQAQQQMQQGTPLAPQVIQQQQQQRAQKAQNTPATPQTQTGQTNANGQNPQRAQRKNRTGQPQ